MSDQTNLRLSLSRTAWVFITGLSFVVLIAALPTGLRQMRTDTPPEILAIVNAGISLNFTIIYITVLTGVVFLIFWAMAGLIAWRKRDDWYALLISATLFIWGVEIFVPIQIGMPALVKEQPGWFWLDPLRFTLVDLYTLLLWYFFPNGRFVPRRIRGVAFTAVALILPGNFFPGTPVDLDIWPAPLNLLLVVVIFGSLVFSQIYRYRRVSTLVERQQTKWFVLGFAMMMVVQTVHFAILPGLVPNLYSPDASNGLIALLDFSIATVSLLLVPIPIAIGILRYRLWDIDLLIRRTLAHGLLTGILAVIYFTSVVAFQRFLPARSDASIVLTTLLVAALFTPLRSLIQNNIDRRFFRKKYNAEMVATSFSATLRNEVDLETISAALTVRIDETIEPEHISLWLREIKL